MNEGHEFKLPQGGEVRVRRCAEDVEFSLTNETRDVIELSIETFHPYWSLVSLALSPELASLLACNLFSEVVNRG